MIAARGGRIVVLVGARSTVGASRTARLAFPPIPAPSQPGPHDRSCRCVGETRHAPGGMSAFHAAGWSRLRCRIRWRHPNSKQCPYCECTI
jgi:hypothetical protein